MAVKLIFLKSIALNRETKEAHGQATYQHGVAGAARRAGQFFTVGQARSRARAYRAALRQQPKQELVHPKSVLGILSSSASQHAHMISSEVRRTQHGSHIIHFVRSPKLDPGVAAHDMQARISHIGRVTSIKKMGSAYRFHARIGGEHHVFHLTKPLTSKGVPKA